MTVDVIVDITRVIAKVITIVSITGGGTRMHGVSALSSMSIATTEIWSDAERNRGAGYARTS